MLTNNHKIILVTGGGGYIGTQVVQKLLENNYKVRMIDKFIFEKKNVIYPKYRKNLEVINASICDIKILNMLFTNVNTIIHLAGIVGDDACMLDTNLSRKNNIDCMSLLIDKAVEKHISKFIFASSCSVYGSTGKTVNEESRINPQSFYAESKSVCEKELLSYQIQYFNPVILRFASVYGHSIRMRFDLAVNLFVAQAYQNGVIIINDSNKCRPFIHVSDASDSIIKILETPIKNTKDQIYNIGENSQNMTIGNLAKLVKDIVKKDKKGNSVRIISETKHEDNRNYKVSFNKIFNRIGFKPKITLRQGINEIYHNLINGKYNKPFTDPKYDNYKMLKEYLLKGGI